MRVSAALPRHGGPLCGVLPAACKSCESVCAGARCPDPTPTLGSFRLLLGKTPCFFCRGKVHNGFAGGEEKAQAKAFEHFTTHCGSNLLSSFNPPSR